MIHDVLVIGAGPAGLTAAVYLARYRRDVLVVHDGRSRALQIARTHNVPGFPGGVTGPELMDQMEAQATLYGARLQQDEILELAQGGAGFCARGRHADYEARAVILATGVVLNQIDLSDDLHQKAIDLGCLRYCPICDGYEATGKRVAIIGSSTHGAEEALFLRAFTDQVTLLPAERSELTADERRTLAEHKVTVTDSPAAGFEPTEGGMQVALQGGQTLLFDVVYPALGVTPRSELATALGLDCAEGGCIRTDAHQEVGMDGMFAAGDVVDALDQISVASGHGAIAATRAHNHLRSLDGAALT